MHLKRIMTAATAMLLAVLTVFGVFCFIPSVEVNADTVEKKQISRMINVVYDDSNSMLMDSRLWWCYAKYSLEVFSAMMQDKDCMNVYFMSDDNAAPRIANLSGDRAQQQKNISKIHNTVTYTSGTPFNSIVRAYSDLKSTDGYDEKWLMVITDGDSFNNNESAADLDALIRNCEAYNIKVVYLAIGDALVPTDAPNKGIYVYKADGDQPSGNTGILARVTQICQRIFERPSLKSASTSKIKIDVPVSEIIVFAQGDDVSVGDINGARKIVSAVEMNSSDKDKATTNTYYSSGLAIDTLNASIVTFVPKTGSYIPEGTYELSVDADEYAVYYKPCLDVILKLYDIDGNEMVDDYIPIGSYSIKYWLTYPEGHAKHGEKISQGLFDVEYNRTCTVEGSTRTLNSDKIDLGAGTTTIRVVADYLNFSSSDASLVYVVEDFTIDELDVDIEYIQRDYRLSTLETDNDGFIVKVSKNGSPIPSSDWERFGLKFDIDNPEFKVVKNKDSTFTVYPQYKNGEKIGTATGDVDFKVTAYAENDHRTTDSGTAKGSVNIYDDVTAAKLGIHIDEQSTECDNKNFPDQITDRKVTIDWNGHLLTREQYDALKLTVDIDNEYLDATIELDPYVEGEPTTATVRFAVKRDKDGNLPKPKHLHGSHTFIVNAEIDNEGQISTGSEKGTLKVADARTCREKFDDVLYIIIPLAILLFLFLAYAPIIKRYLPWSSRYIAGAHGNIQHTINWYSNPQAIVTALLPFVRVRSSASVGPAGEKHEIKVRAQRGKTVTCTNVKSLNGKGIRLNLTIANGNRQTVNLGGLTVTRPPRVTVARFVNH